MARSIDAQPGVRGFVPAQNDEERFLMRHVEDLARAAFGRGIARYSAFLSDREQQLAQAALNRADALEESCRFEGGWPGAERRVLCLEPEGCLPPPATHPASLPHSSSKAITTMYSAGRE